MILHRIGNAFRKQDWFVVLVEVPVVILGVFIGLPFDDWNQTTKDRADEQERQSPGSQPSSLVRA